jgi:hypothetical protein
MQIQIWFTPTVPRSTVFIHAWDQNGGVWDLAGTLAANGVTWGFALSGTTQDPALRKGLGAVLRIPGVPAIRETAPKIRGNVKIAAPVGRLPSSLSSRIQFYQYFGRTRLTKSKLLSKIR